MIKENQSDEIKDPMSTDFYSNKGAGYSYASHRKEKNFSKEYFSLPILQNFINKLRKKERSIKVLDLGSGVGEESNGMNDLLPQSEIFSLDISTIGTREGKDNFDLNQIQADVSNPPFKNDTFDGIHCKDVLVHVPDKEIFIKNIAQLLNPGGVFLLMSSSTIYKKLNQFEWNPKQISHLAKKYGLELITKQEQRLPTEDWYSGGEGGKRVFFLFQKPLENNNVSQFKDKLKKLIRKFF